MNPCSRCGGRLFWDALDQELACLTCGWRITRLPTAQERETLQIEPVQVRPGRRLYGPFHGNKGFRYKPCQYAKDKEVGCFTCILASCKYDAPPLIRQQMAKACRQAVKELRANGLSPAAVAAELGVTQRTVFRLSKEA